MEGSPLRAALIAAVAASAATALAVVVSSPADPGARGGNAHDRGGKRRT
jgi:hypothetical protein